MTKQNPIIVLEQVSKRYKIRKRYSGRFGALKSFFSPKYNTIEALSGISFLVEPGEIVGYIGPNGAGKSTTVKILSGILNQDQGEVRVAGLVPHRDRIKNVQHIGVVFGQKTQLWWDLPLYESFNLMRDLYDIPENLFRENLQLLNKLLDIDSFSASPVRKLSLGQRMRGDLAAAVLHSPDILYLDEPTVGLDVVAKERIRQFLLDLNRMRGATIILATHDMLDIERVCPRIILIDKGKILYDGSREQLIKTFIEEKVLKLKFAKAPPDLQDIDDILNIESDEEKVILQFNTKQISPFELLSQINRRAEILDINITEPDIESIVRRIYNGELGWINSR